MPACSRTTPLVADGFLALVQAHRRGPMAAPGGGSCSTTRSRDFGASDGGFFDTADDAEALGGHGRGIPSDNASPSGLSAMVTRC